MNYNDLYEDLQNSEMKKFVDHFNNVKPVNTNIQILFEKIYSRLEATFILNNDSGVVPPLLPDQVPSIMVPKFIITDMNTVGSYYHELSHLIDFFCNIILNPNNVQNLYFSYTYFTQNNITIPQTNVLPEEVESFFHENAYIKESEKEYIYNGLCDICNIITYGNFENQNYIVNNRNGWDDRKFLILGHIFSYYKKDPESIYTEIFADYIEMNYVSPRAVALLSQLGNIKNNLDNFIDFLIKNL